MGNDGLKQESFLIDEAKRKKILRQDRIQLPPGTCLLKSEEKYFEVLNISAFGISIITKNAMDTKSVMSFFETQKEGKIIFDNFEFQNVFLKKVRSEEVSAGLIIGFECVGEPINIEILKTLMTTSSMLKNVASLGQNLSKIPIEFKVLIYELKDLLLKLKSEISSLEKNQILDNKAKTQEFESTVTQLVAEFLSGSVPSYYKKIPTILNKESAETKKLCTDFAREQIGSLIYNAPFASRAFFKPRGYAGDYEMMNHLYRNESVGESLYDKCLHRYLVDEPAAEAVKNRSVYLKNKIIQMVKESKKDTIKILSVASGPALEQQMFLKDCKEFYGKKIEFVCLDQDEESLKHAQLQLSLLERMHNSGFKFRFVNCAIKNIIINGLDEHDFDFIYTAGLFDYFADSVAQVAAQKLYDGLNDGGTLLIGNFSKENPTQVLMDMFLDWILIYRSGEDLTRIFSPVSKKIVIEKEELGINLFACIKK